MNLSNVGLNVAADTARLAEDIEATFTDTFTIYSAVLDGDGSDGLIENDSATYSEIAGALNHDQESDAETFSAEQNRPISPTRFVIHLQAGVVVLPSDKIVHDQTGDEFEVVTIENRVSEEVATTVRVYRISGEATEG